MSARNDFLTQLWETQRSNRTELLKQLSIISVAGLGFNLIWTKPDAVVFYDVRLWAWLASTLCFLATIIAVLVVFYTITRHAEVQAILRGPGIRPAEAEPFAAIKQQLGIRLERLGVFIFCTFTIAIICASMVTVNDIFF